MSDPQDDLIQEILEEFSGETHLLRELMQTYQALMSAFAKNAGMSASRLTLLRLLAVSHPREFGILEISRLLGIDAAAVTRQVQYFERQSLLSRRSDPADGRRSLIRLTDDGLRLFEGFHRKAHHFEKELVEEATDEEIATTIDVLSRIRAVLERCR